jgi:hypothetical protein
MRCLTKCIKERTIERSSSLVTSVKLRKGFNEIRHWKSIKKFPDEFSLSYKCNVIPALHEAQSFNFLNFIKIGSSYKKLAHSRPIPNMQILTKSQTFVRHIIR